MNDPTNFYRLFYIFSMADKLSFFFAWMAGLSTVSLIIFGLITLFASDYDVQEDHYKKKEGDPIVYKRWFSYVNFFAKASLVIAPIAWLLYISTPTKKEAVMIVAGGYIGSFIQSDSNARQLPADITRFLRTQINDAALSEGLSSLIGKSREEALKDSLSKLSKEELVKLVQEKK